MKPTSDRSRLRLIVVRVLVFSLFATLFARLYYLQVVSGDSYRQAAASQSLREVVVQPQRGLIVDDQGRPLVANRTAWVVSVDRTVLGKLPHHDRTVAVHRLAEALGTPSGRIQRALVTCGDPGSRRGQCWNGSPYQPVPVATDVRQSVALRILEQPEDYPAVLAQQQSLRSYPSPYGVNLADIVGYLSPITAGELKQATRDHDTSVNGASTGGDRAGVRPLSARPSRLSEGRRGLDGPCTRRRGRGAGSPGRHAGHLDRRPGAEHDRAGSARRHRDGARDL
jgi:penicillin-binding protein 2